MLHSSGMIGSSVRLVAARPACREMSCTLDPMSLKQFALLNHLDDVVGVQQQQLGDHLCLAANNLVLLLNEVERAGWAGWPCCAASCHRRRR